MKNPTWSPCRTGSPQKTGRRAPCDDVARNRVRRIDRVLKLTAAADESLGHVDRDPVQHDRRDHLVRADGRLQEARDPGPQRSGERGEHDREHDVQAGVQLDERRADPRRDESADDVLALAADVEEPALEGERDGEAREQQSRRQDQRLLKVERRVRPVLPGDPGEQPVQAGAVEDAPERAERVVAGGRDHDHRHREREDGRDERHHDASGPLEHLQPRRRARGGVALPSGPGTSGLGPFGS